MSLLHENDFFANTDRDYTSGVQMTLDSAQLERSLADRCVPLWFRGTTAFVSGWIDPALGARVQSLSLGQQLFTPTDRNPVTVIRNDRPYAGWLYARLAVHAHDRDRSQTMALELGMIGPIAQGEKSQNTIHKLEGFAPFEGWRNQLRNEMTVQLYRENRQALWRGPGDRATLTGHYGFALGNALTYGNVGARLSIGADPIGGARAAATLGPTAPLSAAGFNAFVGVDLRAVARNAFLDGNSFQDSARVKSRPVVGDLSAGLRGGLLGGELSIVYTLRSHEFVGQTYRHVFGSVMLGFAL